MQVLTLVNRKGVIPSFPNSFRLAAVSPGQAGPQGKPLHIAGEISLQAQHLFRHPENINARKHA